MTLETPKKPEEVGSFEPVPGKCGAKKKQGEGFCTIDPMENGRCYRHGGMSLKGALSPRFKHGGYSQYLPQYLAERFERTQADPELLTHRSDVALVQTRIDELLERVNSGESGAAWKQLNKLWREFERHRTAGDVKNMQAILEQISEPMMRGLADHAAWEELGAQLDRRARLVETERKRLETIQSTMTVEEAMGLLGTVLDVIKRHVPEQDRLDAIGDELEQLVTLDTLPFATRPRRRR